MELLATLASGIAPYTPVTPTVTAANATVIAVPSTTGHLTGLSHASEALNTDYIALLGHLAAGGLLSDNITTRFHYTAGSPVVLMVLTTLCFIDGFFPPLPSESMVTGLTSWFIASPSGTVVPLWAAFLAASVRVMLGDSFALFLGTHIPVEKIPFLSRGRGKTTCDLTRHTLHRRGTSFIFTARFIPGGRTTVNIYIEAMNFGCAWFLHTDFIAVMCWVTYGITIGTVSGEIVDGVCPLLTVAVGITGRLVLNLVVDRLVSWVQKRFWNKPAPDSSGS